MEKEAGPVRAVQRVRLAKHRTLNSHQNVCIHYLAPCRAGLLTVFPWRGSQTLRYTRDFASLVLKHIAEVRLLIRYKTLYGNKMSLRHNRCAAVDTTEIRSKAETKEGM